ncbi:MAG: SOS response-associated peptidase [Pirellulales bacterium]
MCGRFTLRTPPTVLIREFGLRELVQLPLRFNIAPTQSVLAVRAPREGVAAGAASKSSEAVWLRWGLVPFWSEGPGGKPLINARSETAATLPAFRAAFRERRCLIPADGFFEWQTVGQKKHPFFIHRPDDSPLAFAGLWERWHGDGQIIESCTILTTRANAVLRPLHDRMPVILSGPARERWLAGNASVDVLQTLLEPAADDLLVRYEVGPQVNSSRNDGPACVAPLEGGRELTLFPLD